MNPRVIAELINLAISLRSAHGAGKDVTGILVTMICKCLGAYKDHTGKPLDPSLIRAESGI